MRILPLLPLLVAGCSENNLHTVNDAGEGLGAEIEVSPSTIYFGELAGEEAHVEAFTITSVGEKALEVEGIEFGMANASFTLLPNQELSFVLKPEQSRDILVAFQPMGANEEASTVFIHSNDPITPKSTVALIGEGRIPELEISPDPYDFGVTYVGCPNEGDISLTNIGTETLVIDSIEFPEDAFWTDTSYSLPLTLQPEEGINLHVYYDPIEDGDAENYLTVASNEPMGIREALQLGQAEYAGWYNDEWDLMEDPPADIVFLVDQSCSMGEEWTSLMNNFSYFINELSNYTSDWRVMVVNSENGCSDYGFLEPTTPNLESTFRTAVRTSYPSGDNNRDTELLLTIASKAASQMQSGCNAGFWRPNAMLHMIMVSDEPEQTPNRYSGVDWYQRVQEIISAKGSAPLVRLSAIAGDYPNGCSTAQAGTGYYEAVNETGGAFVSICASSWSSYMTTLAATSITQDTFELSSPAAENTIEVAVNGNQQTQNWHYDASRQSVVFDTDIPEGGDNIKVDYAALASCD